MILPEALHHPEGNCYDKAEYALMTRNVVLRRRQDKKLIPWFSHSVGIDDKSFSRDDKCCVCLVIPQNARTGQEPDNVFLTQCVCIVPFILIDRSGTWHKTSYDKNIKPCLIFLSRALVGCHIIAVIRVNHTYTICQLKVNRVPTN